MDNTTKILIIVVIVLVGVLGLVGGFLLQGYFVKNNNSTTNQSNASVNSTNNTTVSNTDSNNQGEIMSQGEAINIAIANVNLNEGYNIHTVTMLDNVRDGKYIPAHYFVEFYSDKTGKKLAIVNLNARTGEIYFVNYF